MSVSVSDCLVASDRLYFSYPRIHCSARSIRSRMPKWSVRIRFCPFVCLCACFPLTYWRRGSQPDMIYIILLPESWGIKITSGKNNNNWLAYPETLENLAISFSGSQWPTSASTPSRFAAPSLCLNWRRRNRSTCLIFCLRTIYTILEIRSAPGKIIMSFEIDIIILIVSPIAEPPWWQWRHQLRRRSIDDRHL